MNRLSASGQVIISWEGATWIHKSMEVTELRET